MLLITHRLPDKSVPVPSPGVAQAEKAIEKSLVSKEPADQLSRARLDAQFPLRPGYGTRGGSKVTLWTNYIDMMPTRDLKLHRYEIKIDPDDFQGKKLGRMVQLFLQSPNMDPLRYDVVTDLRKILISRIELSPAQCQASLQYMAEGEDTPKDNERHHRVTLQPSGFLTISELLDYLNSTDLSHTYDGRQDIIQALNIMIAQYAKSRGRTITVSGNRAFDLDSAARFDLGGGLIAMRGFFSSVRLATARILINVNVTHGAFYRKGPLAFLMKDFNNAHGDFSLNRFLKRVRVQAIHREKKNKAGHIVPIVKTIWGLATPSDGKSRSKDKGKYLASEQQVPAKAEAGGQGGISTAQGSTHPPIVRRFGAGPAEVEFYTGAQRNNGYISVFDHFQSSKASGSPHLLRLLILR